MNNKKQLKISGFIIAIGVIIVMAIVFLFAVQVPFLLFVVGYKEKHESATSKINYYNSYLSNANSVESAIASMIEVYQTKNPILFSNATKTPNEIRTVLKKLKYEISALSIATGVEDEQGRTTVEGGRLMATSINFRFTGTADEIKKTLDYLELQADGAYYINAVTYAPHVTQAAVAGESSVSTTSSTKGAKYDFSVSMSLYYFEKVEIIEPSSSVAAQSST